MTDAPQGVTVTLAAIYEMTLEVRDTQRDFTARLDPIPGEVKTLSERVRNLELSVASGPPRAPWYAWMSPLVALAALAVALIPKLAG